MLILGLGTSWYMIDVGTPLTTVRQGPWIGWTIGRPRRRRPLHARALHAARIAAAQRRDTCSPTSPTPTATAAACTPPATTRVEGREPGTNWWSITVFNDRGELIANPAQRYAFTSQTIALRPDGTFVVALARDARPGNWLPTGGAGRLALTLTTIDATDARAGEVGRGAKPLPVIRRVQCR